MLRRARELDGYVIGATDGEIGRVFDIRLDDRRWMVRAVVIDVGRPVLIRAAAVDRIDAKQRTVFARLTSAQIAAGAHRDSDKSVRSVWEFTAHDVQGLDVEIGRVADVLFDERTWAITHLVVALDDGPRERHVLVPVGWVTWVSWDARAVVVALRSEVVRSAPRYDGWSPLDVEDEARVSTHYGRPPFDSK